MPELSFVALGDDGEVVGHVAERLVGISYDRPEGSVIGIVVTAVSLTVMLWLARAKRRTGRQLGSRALIADAAQTQACWYLSATTLAGLALNAIFGLWWADPVAAYGIAVFLVREGVEAWRAEEHEHGEDELGGNVS